MRKIGLAILLGLSLFFIVYGLGWAAGPYLVCNAPVADEQVLGYKGTVNGTAFTTPYALHASGAAIIYDCATLGSGKWDFVNIRAYNVRGESAGIPFVYPAIPGSPVLMRVVP